MLFDGNDFVERLKIVSGGKTQTEIAEDLHIDKSNITNWKNKDKNILPKLETILYIAETYNCSVDYLLGLNDYTIKFSPRLEELIIGLLAYDMSDSKNRISFKTEPDQVAIILNYDVNGDIPVNYPDLVESYLNVKQAFKYLNEEQKKSLIKDLLVKKVLMPLRGYHSE